MRSFFSVSLFARFSTHEQVLFAKRLSFLVRAGVPLHESIGIIRDQTKSARKRNVFTHIMNELEAGQHLATALEKYHTLFGPFTIALIRIGEQTGALGENLAYLASELGKRHSLRRKVLGALIYPLFISIVTIVVTSALIMFIFPKIMPLFSSLDIPLPYTTQLLLFTSVFLKEWGLVSAGVLALVIIIFFFVRSHFFPVKYTTDLIMMRMPFIGTVIRSYNSTNFCRTLGLTLRAGLSISEGLRITALSTQNTVYARMYKMATDGVMRGETVSSQLLLHENSFPQMLPHMLRIGETSGSLTDTLGYLSDHFENEVDEYTKNLSNSVEPVLLITMGLLVGLVAISVITPIYEVTRHIQNT